jgi:hypothetical protein
MSDGAHAQREKRPATEDTETGTGRVDSQNSKFNPYAFLDSAGSLRGIGQGVRPYFLNLRNDPM